MSSSVLNGVGEWNNLNLNYRINIFSKNYSWFSRGVGGSCEFCDKAHALPTSFYVQTFLGTFQWWWWWCVCVGGSFQAADWGGDSFFMSFT